MLFIHFSDRKEERKEGRYSLFCSVNHDASHFRKPVERKPVLCIRDSLACMRIIYDNGITDDGIDDEVRVIIIHCRVMKVRRVLLFIIFLSIKSTRLCL